jgi:ATP-dependent DNA helicase RecG
VLAALYFISLKLMSKLLGRKPDVLRIHYLSKMVKDSKLMMRYADRPNHPEQAYKATAIKPNN